MRSTSSNSTALFRVLDLKLSRDSSFAPTLQKIETDLGTGLDFSAALRRLGAAQRTELESRLGKNFVAELASLGKEADSELFWTGLVHAAQRYEARESAGDLPALLSSWLQDPELEDELRRRLETKLENASGRGSFGARSEFMLAKFQGQAFDLRIIAPMLAAGVVGKLAQSALLGRMAVAAPSWINRGLSARMAAMAIGFGSEISVLGLAHGDMARSALSLAAMKAGNAGGAQLRLPLPLVLFAATVFGLKAEEALGWRQTTSFAATLLDAGASALTFGVGFSLAHRYLGPRFEEFMTRLKGPPQKTLSQGTISLVEPSLVSAVSSKAENFIPIPKPLMMEGLGNRSLPNAQGPARSFELIFSPQNRRPFLAEAEGAHEQRMEIARRDDSSLWLKIDKKALVTDGDPITPTGVTRVLFRLEEGDTRGRAFVHYDSKAVTLTFIDLEETMITGGPAMRPGTGSVFMTWLAEQAWSQGKSFNVSHITSPQTVRILEKMKLAGPQCRVEACVRIDPESYDEEYRVIETFSFGDQAKWNQHRREADFYNVFGEAPPSGPHGDR